MNLKEHTAFKKKHPKLEAAIRAECERRDQMVSDYREKIGKPGTIKYSKKGKAIGWLHKLTKKEDRELRRIGNIAWPDGYHSEQIRKELTKKFKVKDPPVKKARPKAKAKPKKAKPKVKSKKATPSKKKSRRY